MPSIAAYTPYETLKLCQSVAQQGTDALAFQQVAVALNANPLIREGDSYDASRLTADALRGLYDDLVRQEAGAGSPKVNGDAAAESANPRKRKSPASPVINGEHNTPPVDEEGSLQALVARLYTRFREDAIREIKRDEDEYAKLQKEIDELEQGKSQKEVGELEQDVAVAVTVDTAQAPAVEPPKPSLSETTTHKRQGSKTDISALLSHDDGPSTPRPNGDESGQAIEHQATAPPPTPQPPSPSVQDLTAAQHHQQTLPAQQSSPGAFHRQLPPPSPQRNQFNHPPPSQHGFVLNSAGHQVPIHSSPGVHVQHMPMPMDHLTQNRASAASTPTRNSPVPPQHQFVQPYPGYATPYQQPPPHWQPPYPQAPYPQQHMPYRPPQGYYPAQGSRPGGPYQPPPAQGPYPPYAQTPPSPTRPVREVSPLSDSESDHRPRYDSAPPRAPDHEQLVRSTRSRGRHQSMTPSVSAAVKSRSQSAVSQRSDTPSERSSIIKRDTQKIKTETPPTPVPHSLGLDPVESVTRSSGRTRGRLRNNDLSSTPSTSARTEVTRTSPAKRKHPSTDHHSPSPAALSPTPARQSGLDLQPRFLLLVSKNFAKTSQLLLNEIQSHKLAGIFAKPLTQRDAPGYKDLIFRPMDLKTLRAAVTKGSRAAIAAIEVLEDSRDGRDGDEQTDTQHDTHHEHGREREIGNGFWLVRPTEELVPPKGIVNASQLEMELARMFANAVMFNPLPGSERGFGKALRLRRFGGEYHLHSRAAAAGAGAGARRAARDRDDSDQGGGIVDEESDTSESEADNMEEGIIADAREMFEDTMNKLSDADAQLQLENEASTTAPTPVPEVVEPSGVERRKRRRVGE
ncbi:hypothetical protein DV738_g4607, partial [Chaetothyriales sp. CBS 135597]